MYQCDLAIDTIVSQVYLCLVSLWRFQAYSDSRRLSCGKSCRVLMIGMVTGLGQLVADLPGREDVSKFHIEGRSRMASRHLHFVAQASLSSFFSENLLVQLLGDGRAPETTSDLDIIFKEELAWIHCLSEYMWRTVTSAAGMCHAVIEHCCTRGCHISAGYAFDKSVEAMLRAAVVFSMCRYRREPPTA